MGASFTHKWDDASKCLIFNHCDFGAMELPLILCLSTDGLLPGSEDFPILILGTNANTCGVPSASISCFIADSCLVPFLSEQGIWESVLIFNYWAIPDFQVDFGS